MTIKIGNDKILLTEGMVTITFTNGLASVTDGSQAEYLYINPNEVKTVVIEEIKKA